jgi:hypothetical protein
VAVCTSQGRFPAARGREALAAPGREVSQPGPTWWVPRGALPQRTGTASPAPAGG